ncbi:MAG: hypothetical protein O8C63_02355 [Candidatus Methanoperedens sp.]|nr:hypothetical protein [Candidatus Methanoperedens sp.]
MIELILVQKNIEIYAWIVASIIMIFITAIAKFYQEKFGIKTFYYFYIFPIIVIFAAAVHVFSYNTFLSETLEVVGALGSFLASYYLYRVMVGMK